MANKESLLEALDVALKNGSYVDLEKLAKETITETPDLAIGYYCLAEANWLNAKHKNAEICMAKAIELDAENASYLLRLADFKMAQDAMDDARLLYSKALDLDPNNSQVLLGLATYLIDESGDYPTAIEFLNQVLKVNEKDTHALFLRAQAQLELELFEEALEDIDQVLAEEVGEAALVLKINILTELFEQDEVKATYKELLALQTERQLDYHISYGNYLLSYAFNEEAEEQIKMALQMIGDNYDGPLHGILGLALAGQNKYPEALKVFNEMASKTPEDEEIYIQRAEVHRAMGDKKAALEDLQKATSMLSGETKQLLLYKQAQLFIEFKDWAAAIDIYKELIKAELFVDDATYGLGEALFYAGDAAGAFKMMRQAQKLKHPNAKEFLEQHFAKQLLQIQEKILAQYAAELPKNEASKLLQTCFGQYCKFDAYRNKPAGNLPPDFIEAILKEISDTGFLITAQGLLLLNPIERKPLLATYRIEEEDDTEVLLEVIPLDGAASYSAILSVSGKVVEFEPQLLKAQKVTFKLTEAQKLTDADKKAIKEYVSAESIAYLGEAAAPFIKSVFG